MQVHERQKPKVTARIVAQVFKENIHTQYDSPTILIHSLKMMYCVSANQNLTL